MYANVSIIQFDVSIAVTENYESLRKPNISIKLNIYVHTAIDYQKNIGEIVVKIICQILFAWFSFTIFPRLTIEYFHETDNFPFSGIWF